MTTMSELAGRERYCVCELLRFANLTWVPCCHRCWRLSKTWRKIRVSLAQIAQIEDEHENEDEIKTG
jgi:hypothetical protein